MNKLDVTQDSHSSPDFSWLSQSPTAAHLLTYLKKLKVQKIFLSA
jgi:hypothetical protein